MVWLFVLVPEPDPGYPNKTVPGTRAFSRGQTYRIKLSGTDGEVVRSLPKCRVRIWTPCRTYRGVGYGYGRCIKITKGSGTGIDVVQSLPKGRVRVWMFYQAYKRVGNGTATYPRIRTRPQEIQQGRTRYQGIFPWAYRTYQSVGYGSGSRTKLTKVSGTGMDDVPKLQKGRVRVWMWY